MSTLNEFIDYVWSFYNEDSDLYPIKDLTKHDILEAYCVYLNRIKEASRDSIYYDSWGGGDSLDRERVRDIILEKPQFSWSC